MSRYDNKDLTMAGVATRNIHYGINPDPLTGAMTPPIYQTTTYAQEAVGVNKGHTYSRSSNPTVSVLEAKLAGIEYAKGAYAYATGLAATTALIMSTLRQGDHIICSDVIFGGTVRLIDQIFSRYGIKATYVDASDLNKFADSFQSNTKLVFLESPANPTMKLNDIQAICNIAHANNVLVCVDNTFLTGVLQRPLELGADIVLYSTTKYIEGHNAAVGGALLSNNDKLLEEFNFIRKSVGFIQSPFDAWITMQGIKTLELRVHQHSKNALEVAKFLEVHPSVKLVNYPGLASFYQSDLASKQHLSGMHGGMLSFEVSGGFEHALNVMNSVQLFTLAESLGATESLITHPASMTHVGMTVEQRKNFGIDDGLIRLSIGLENVEDIILDIKQAIEKEVL
jgi:cystathionine beta-lyase/cystathionine gamma-synthase